MDLTLIGILLFLTGSSHEYPEGQFGNIFLDSESYKNIQTRESPWLHYTRLGDDEDDADVNDPLEDKLKRLDFKGDPTLDYLINHQIPQESIGLILSKRDISPEVEENDITNEFIEQKLIEHGQALEKIMKMVKKNERVTKRLLRNLMTLIEKPKLPKKVEEPKQNRRSDSRSYDVEPTEDNPIVRIGKNLPKYGSLLKSLVLAQVDDVTDPIPLVEVAKSNADGPSNRRSNNELLDTENVSERDGNKISWCENAVLCKKSKDPICGFDDSFGYGMFDDICHMLEVNCYYKNNFVLAPTCKSYRPEQ